MSAASLHEPAVKKKHRIILVDDSAIVRHVLTRSLEAHPDIEIVGTAADPYEARDLVVRQTPDAIVLDILMPRMNGLTFLGKLMKHHPVPVIVLSSLTAEGSAMALHALDSGAVAVFQKPSGDHESVQEVSQRLVECIRAIGALTSRFTLLPTPPTPAPRSTAISTFPPRALIAIGASTGGTQAIPAVLGGFPPTFPPVLIVQHMPGAFTPSFAARLAELTTLDVREARDGDVLRPGLVLLAPGGRHMVLRGTAESRYVSVYDGPLVGGHCPSVNVFFKSVAAVAGKDAIGVLLTGMGSDGAEGMLELKQKGALTIAQNESSCVVYGMPAEAVKLGAVDAILPPAAIPAHILSHIKST